MQLLGKKILVIGLGKSGLSAVRFLLRKGARVAVSEMMQEGQLDPETLRVLRQGNVELETGGHREETFLASEMIVVSPGVPLEIAPLKAAAERGIPVLGEMELACGWIDTPLVAVTGTNGKSTITEFIGSMLTRAGLRAFVGGNLGTPLIDYAAGVEKTDYAVVEVSSFQLDTMKHFSPLVGVLLNITPDHLDRYSSYKAYVQSKLSIFQNQGKGQTAILNDDDPSLHGHRPPKGVSVLRYGVERKEGRHAYLEEGKIRASLPGAEVSVFNLERFTLPGAHNIENMMGGILAGLALHIGPRAIQETIDSFKGLPHRMQLVGTIGGVEFYDDSKATNVDAARRSILAFDRPLILIAGGRHKGADYAPLVEASQGRVKQVVLLGESKDLLAGSFEGHIPFSFVEDMADAVSLGLSVARSGDVVLLAPACSSFDMFTDYAHRGRVFKESVERVSRGG